MAVDKINVTGDTRVERQTAQVNGKTYGEQIPRSTYQPAI